MGVLASFVVVLEVRLLGQPQVLGNGRSLDAFASGRLLSLLTFLVLNRHAPVRRQHIAFLFWPNSSERQAQTNLRQALFNLRRALPEPDAFLQADVTAVRWRLDAPASIDVLDFDEATAEADRRKSRAALERAVALYAGDLLPGCYEDWIEPERERLRQAQVRLLEQLSDICESQGDADAAIRWAQRLIHVDPLHEASYRRLMRLHLDFGERARALRAYHSCASVLERELGVSPQAATIELYESLVAGNAPIDVGRSETVRGPTLVGRRAEWQRLQACLRAMQKGTAGFVLVSGEPGVGKSRLVEDFRAWCARQGLPTAGARSYEAEGHLPYAPIAELLRSSAIRPTLGALDDVWLSEIARVVPELVTERPGLSMPVGHEASERSRLFEALARALAGTGRPLVLVVDDLQWCDPETLEFLHFVVRFASGVPLLVIGSAREEAFYDSDPLRALIAGLRAIDTVVEVPLARLDTADAAALANELLGESADDAMVGQLVDEAEGSPLFLVELARSGLVTATATGPTPALPPKVQAVIEVRLGQLSAPARQVVGTAAVVGRAFDGDAIARLLPDLGDDVVGALDELWRRGIVREQGRDAYDFSHDKIREVAYEALGPARRRRLHFEVARALESLHADNIEPVAAQIAAHYDRAGTTEPAVAYYVRAIQAAQHLFAHQDVIRIARRGLELVEALPAGVERNDRELSFLLPLGVALYAGSGILDNELFARATALSSAGGLPTEPSTLRLSANAAIARRDFAESDRCGRLLLARGKDTHDSLFVTEGHYLRGVSSFWRGQFAGSHRHLERALAAYQPERSGEHLERFAQDARAVCLVRLSWSAWHLGRFVEAESLRDQALAQADTVEHDYTIGYVRTFAAWAAAEAGSVVLVTDLVSGLPDVDENRWQALLTRILLAWIEARTGSVSSATDALMEAAENARVTEQLLFEPVALVFVADAHLRSGSAEAGLAAATAAREIAHREMQFHHGEARRLEGLLLSKCGADPDVVEPVLRDAVDIAMTQGSVVLAERASASLHGWRRRQ